MRLGNGEFWLGDCLELMSAIPDGSVDMVLCDLPYGTTQNKWDAVIPFDPLWREYWRVCKPNAAVVLTGAQPFTSALVMSQVQHFKYDWCWKKPKGTGHLNAKKMPMRDKEDILVFYRQQPTYNPQWGQGKAYSAESKGSKRTNNVTTENYGSHTFEGNASDGRRYPKQVIDFPVVERGSMHPTQKPEELWRYLMETYTNPGDLVLDNCAGSGTTSVAAEQTGRRWLCIEREPAYYYGALGRIAAAITPA